MSDASVQLFRFTCPYCQKVLKAPLEWSGKRGVCPGCQKPIEFPRVSPPSAKSRTAEQLIKLVSEYDNVSIDDQDIDQVAMYLSLGTCADYHKTMKRLGDKEMSAKQWRKALNSAAARENMRLHIEEQLDKLADISDEDEEEPGVLAVVGEVTNPNAWKIMARYLYYLRHGTCEECKKDLTGLSCMYLAWESFCIKRLISENRAASWEKIIRHHLGL